MSGVRLPQALAQVLGTLNGRVSIRIRPAIVAVLASLDIAWQTVARLSLPGEALAAVGSFVVGGILSLGVAPDLVAIPLYGYLVYVLTPTVFPERLRFLTERRDFRLLCAGHAAVVPLALFTTLPGAGYLGVAGLVVLPAYLLVVQGRSVLGPDGYPVAFFNVFEPARDVQANLREELKEDQAPSPRFWLVMAGICVIAIAYTYLVFLLLGGLVSLLFLLYPFPELLLLGWVGYRSLVVGRFGSVPEGIAERRYDLETRVLEVAGVATDGFKGFMSVTLASFGLVVPVLFVFFATAAVGSVVAGVGAFASATQAELFAASIGLVTVAVYGLYGTWYWLRTLFRIPHALAAWRSTMIDDMVTPPDRELGPLVPRPPGYFLPAAALLLSLGLLVETGGWPDAARVSPPVLGVWLVCLAATGWSAYRGIVGDPQPPITERVTLPVSYVVHMSVLWLWVDMGTGDWLLLGVLTGEVAVTRLEQAILHPETLLFLLILVLPLYAFFVYDLFYLRERDDWRQYLWMPFFLATGLGLAVVALAVTGATRLVTIGLSLAAFVILAGGLYEERLAEE